MSPNKVIAALLVIVFVIFSSIAIQAWSVRKDILNADRYVEVLEETDFFEVPYQLIREGEIPEAGGLLLKEGPLSVVSGPARETIARELAPPDWLRAQLERAVRDIIAVAATPEVDDLPGLNISLREVKRRALGEAGDRALSIAVEALPVCEPDRLPLELGRDIPICKPADVDLLPFLHRLKPLLVPLAARVPDTYTVRWQPDQREVLEDLRRAGRTLDRLQLALLLWAALNVALLALVWVLAVRSPAEWLRWTGVPLLLLGLAVLLVAVLAPRVVAWGLDSRELWTERNVPAPLARSLEESIENYIPLLFRPALSAGLVLTVVGLLLTLISPLFPEQRQRGSVSTPEAAQSGRYSPPR